MGMKMNYFYRDGYEIVKLILILVPSHYHPCIYLIKSCYHVQESEIFEKECNNNQNIMIKHKLKLK